MIIHRLCAHLFIYFYHMLLLNVYFVGEKLRQKIFCSKSRDSRHQEAAFTRKDKQTINPLL
jgi:hypothetical protein